MYIYRTSNIETDTSLQHTVAMKMILLFFSLFFPLFSIFFSPVHADIAPTAPITSTNACNSTPYPYFCKSILPKNRSSNLYDYGRFSIHRALKSAGMFTDLINRKLKNRSSLPEIAIRALEDCLFLSGLSTDFLLKTEAALNSTNSLPSSQTIDIQTLLSAIVTNQQTCFEGLKTSSDYSLQNSLYDPLSNDTRLFSVSLALFTHAWVHKMHRGKGRNPGRELMFSYFKVGSDGNLPLRMSNRNRDIFQAFSKRRVLESSVSDGVLVSDVVIVAQNGDGNFTSINDAVAAAPNNTNIDDGYFLIYVVAGVYEEYVSVAKNKKNLMMVGDGINQTVITGNRSVVDGWTTFNSATFAVVAERFVATDITFRNTAGAAKHQAVAVRNGADLSTFYSCSFEGYQDTLYTHSLRQFYRECDIYGTVDFIFGNAAVVLQNCNIYPRLPMAGQNNMITAQGRTDPNQNTGTSIHNCTIRATADLASNGSSIQSYLGRPWKEYSRTVIMQTFIDKFINPAGWSPWSGDFALKTLYYGEYNNSGGGAATLQRVSWPGFHVMNAYDASNFTVSNFILGESWLSPTGVPNFGGLF